MVVKHVLTFLDVWITSNKQQLVEFAHEFLQWRYQQRNKDFIDINVIAPPVAPVRLETFHPTKMETQRFVDISDKHGLYVSTSFEELDWFMRDKYG